MTFLPSEKYSLVMFCGGLNKISWIWGVKFLKKFLLDESNLDNLNKVITVHEGWFIKTLTGLLSNYHLTRKNLNLTRKLLENFKLGEQFELRNESLLQSCYNLHELNHILNLKKIKISLNVLKQEYQLDGNKYLVFNSESRMHPLNNRKHHMLQIFNIINSYGHQVELIFHKPGNRLSSEIFVDCITKDQMIWINDWNIYCIATSFKRLVNDLPTLIPVSKIHLPLKDDTIEYNFSSLLSSHPEDLQIILVSLFNLFHKLVSHSHITKLTSKILAKTFVQALSHEVYSKSNENLIIVHSFIKKVIDNWENFSSNLKSVQMEDIFSVKETRIEEHSYIDYDMTVDSDSDLDQDTEVEIGVELEFELSPKKILASNDTALNTFASNSSIGSVKTLNMLTSIPNFNTPATDVHSLRSVASHATFDGLSPQKGSPIRRSLQSPERNILVQYPPQKYHFSKPSALQISVESQQLPPPNPKFKPVIRGVKVLKLAKLYEERAQGLELLRSL